MKPLAAVIPYSPRPFFEKTLLSLAKSALVESIVIISQEPIHLKMDTYHTLVAGPLPSQEALRQILSEIRTNYLLLLPEPREISIEPKALERFLMMAESTKAGLVYSDFYDGNERGKALHPLNDYQPGSVRDDFDFGAMTLFSVSAIRKALKKYGDIPQVKFAGFYDLRLKLSIDHSMTHLKEPLYSVIKTDEPFGSEKLFAYLDPQNRAVQKEMEAVFTQYLKKIGAFLPPNFKEVDQTRESFPVEASVIIPVRNRRETIAEAVKSALSQETVFPFNVIVVDNHSTDGTSAILSDLASQYSRFKHIIPVRTDLGIGGCWNEALYAQDCGRYVIQLDSDDLYSGSHSLQKMVDMLHQGNYAMVIGSYSLVDSNLNEIPPGLIDHREWTDENGRNNALRINGLGAPRAFNTSLMRKIRFLNVSYGEDYAAALRICREHRIGRIYESLYLCRRWSGNSDAALSIEETNQNDAFKDQIRTEEIAARRKMHLLPPSPLEREGEGGGKVFLEQMSRRDILLNQKTYATFDGGENLSGLCLKLLSKQKKTWLGLGEGYESLKNVRERDLACGGFSARLQYNPGRMKSSTAEVSKINLKERKCFLCLDHLPKGQKGIRYRSDYLILGNPMPVFSSHLTVSHVDHRLQAIDEHIGTYLQLMADLGPSWTVLYNGPKCGASAPDHFHFQAAPLGKMPIEKEIREGKRLTLIKQVDKVLLYRVRDLGREAIILEGDDPILIERVLKDFLNALKKVLTIDEEPMMNIAGFYKGGKWCLMIFPRRKHRPDVFSKDGDARVVVSPGVIDMGGLLITPVKKDFERLDATAVEEIFREVSLGEEIVEQAIQALK
jgi:glycosyltransferase involved in cell wall biosynthesis